MCIALEVNSFSLIGESIILYWNSSKLSTFEIIFIRKNKVVYFLINRTGKNQFFQIVCD